ncbi:MAG: DUF4124 domain-containing protein [Dissulfurispiraceae bacterium]
MKRSLIALLVILLFCIFVSSTYAAMYRWVDEKGRVWITDYPDPRTAKKHKQDANGPDSGQAAEQSAAQTTADQENQKKDIPGLSYLPENLRGHITDIIQSGGLSLMSTSTLAMISGFMVIFGIAFYIYGCLCLYMIARKVGVMDPWTAWIPFVNIWTFVEAAGKPWWWTAIIVGLFLSAVVPVVGIAFGLLNICVVIYLWMCISENLGKNRWLGLLMLIPIVNLFYPAVLAFAKPGPDAVMDSPAGGTSGRS